MNSNLISWLDALELASHGAVNKVILFAPNLVFALVLLLIGSLLGRLLGLFIEKGLSKLKVTEMTSSLNVNQYIEPFGFKSVPHLIGKLAYLFVFLISFVAAADILHLPQVTSLVQAVLLYIPKAIVAILILLVGMWASRISEGVLKGELIQKFPVLKSLVRFLIITFALLAALDQFQISPRLIEILFAGLIFAMSLATGLAFGLGGKDFAKGILDKLKQ